MIHHSRLKGAPRVPGLVSEPASQGAKDEQDLGPGEHHGGVRAVRGHGSALPSTARHHYQERGARRMCGAVAVGSVTATQ